MWAGSAKYKIKDSCSFDLSGQDGGLFTLGNVHSDKIVPAGLLSPAQEVIEIGRQGVVTPLPEIKCNRKE